MRSEQDWLHGCVICTVAQGSTFRKIHVKSMLYCCHLEILKNFWRRGPAFSFCTGPHKLYSQLWKLVNLWERTIYGQFNSFPLLLSLVSTCVWKGYGWVSSALVGSLMVNKLFLWARLWSSRLALTRWADLPHSGACISHMSKSCFPIVLLVLKLIILFPVAWLFCVSLTWFRAQVADRGV